MLVLGAGARRGGAVRRGAAQLVRRSVLPDLVVGCPIAPLPAGPFVSESDKRVQAHRRAEKGTTCWLAGECDRPNAYAYDRDIAEAFRKAVAGPDRLPGTTLWVTVQGRVLYIEGCALQNSSVAAVEALARSLPHVQQAIAIVRTDPTSPPPYKLRSP